MAWATKFFGIAESAAIDTRGNITASGLCVPFLLIDALPAQIAPWAILIVENTEIGDDRPQSVVFQLGVTGPDGDALVAMQQEMQLVSKRLKGVAPRAQVVSQLPMHVPKPGDYRVHLSLDFKSLGKASEDLTLPIWDQETFSANQES
jgi:hypothetical protein